MGGIGELLVGEMIQVVQFVKPHTFFQAFKSKVVLVAKKIRLPMQVMKQTQVQSLGGEDPLEKRQATHSSILAWKIQWTESLAGSSPWIKNCQMRLNPHTCIHIYF